jgi:hypothetical protein
MDRGITCLEKCGQETCELCIHLMMCHTQKVQVPKWLPTEMWTMAENYRTKYQNYAIPYYNKTWSGQAWRDSYDLVKLALWSAYATKQNLIEMKKGHVDKYDSHFPKWSYMDVKLWGVMDEGLCHSQLNLSQSIVCVGEPQNKSALGQQAHLSRSQTRALEKAKVDPKTFNAIDIANKALIVKKRNRVAMKVYEVGKDKTMT